METLVNEFGAWLDSIGSWAYLLAPLAMTLVAILPVPAELPAVLNGMIFGPVLGTLFTWGGALAGAQISFELARKFGRPLAERLVPERSLEKADEIVLTADWWGLLLPRFIPLIAFTPLNWGAGLTAVRRSAFFWTTAVGIFPGAVVFTASGAGLEFLLERFSAISWVTAGLITAYGARSLYRKNSARRSRAPEVSSPSASGG